jgi:hypothetical protein
MTHQNTLKGALLQFRSSDSFRERPLQVRTAFDKIIQWLPDRDGSLPLDAITASFARTLRDRAARERGWKFANTTLVLVQMLVGRAIETGVLAVNSVKQVPKLPPPPLPASTCRRRIKPVRGSISLSANLLKKENSSI